MDIKAVSFDIGQTLVKYNSPLNWESLYEPALSRVFAALKIPYTQDAAAQAARVLTKYNTRKNPREYEVSSETIFKEIFDVWHEPYDKLAAAKEAFYSFFQSDAVCYDDAEQVLQFLKSKRIKIGASTDIAYGMDNALALSDIAPIREYFDLVLTSNDIGYRKPNAAGYIKLMETFDVSPFQMMYVGDEEKDIFGANSLGIISVLVNRTDIPTDFGQKFTVANLSDICKLL